MEIKPGSSASKHSLHFRLLAPIIPIIVLMVILGGAVYSFGLVPAARFADARLAEDLERNSREVYDICDTALQSLMLGGLGEAESAVAIGKGNTLGKIEEYARQRGVQITVYENGQPQPVLLAVPWPSAVQNPDLETLRRQPIVHFVRDRNDYYARQFDFDLWNWRIVVIKDGETYDVLVESISRGYYAIAVVLLVVSLILVLYFRRVIHKPVRSIIASIQADGLPDYKGIYEFEFLSNVIRDATEKEKEKQIAMSYQASHDELTGLANRREFERRLAGLLRSAGPGRTTHTILYLDLDQFKIINDTCGHNAGDALLQQLTRLLKERLRHSDVLARLGGDEFGVLLENCSGDPAIRIAETLRQTVSDFRFVWGSKFFSVGVSIGLVTFGNDELALNEILSMVDGACYIAKDKGRNRVHVYHANDSDVLERKGQMNWVARISHALEEDRLVLYQQRIAPLQRSPDKVMHFEVLLRMADEDGRLIPPSAFLPAAERYNLMPAIDFWVIKHAFQYYRAYCTRADVAYTCSINLSGATLGDERLVAYIREQFAASGIPPSGICFEITETAAIANLKSALSLISELKQLGCRFALDDFGSGMSSFGYLKNLPVDYIKIDGSFVKSMLNDRIDRAMVEAINHIAREIGIQTIAEFVEDDALREALREMKIDFAQGFGIARPEPMAPIQNAASAARESSPALVAQLALNLN